MITFAYGIVLDTLQCWRQNEWMNVLKGYAFGMIGSVSPTIH